MNTAARAFYKGPGVIAVQPLGLTKPVPYHVTFAEAAELRDQLTAALEEAKRQADPFEVWYSSVPTAAFQHYTTKDLARAIWDAAAKATKEAQP